MNNPEYVKIDDRKYKMNTDYRNILKLDEIAKEDISEYEKMLAFIYIMYGEAGLENSNDYERLINNIFVFIQGRPSARKSTNKVVERDMDYQQDMNLIISSIWSEYGIDITKEKIHWWTFFDLLNGLSSECALNRIREIRTKDLSKIKNKEERDTYIELKEIWSLNKTAEMTEEQKRSSEEFYKNFVL